MEVGYLGHVASAEGLQTDLAKLQAVIEFSVCQDIEVILGLASYYRRFIPQFARIAGHLYTLTKKNVEFI